MTTKLKLFSFLMMTSCIFCTGALAQGAPTGSFAGLVSVNVSLKAKVSSRDAKAGQIVYDDGGDPRNHWWNCSAKGNDADRSCGRCDEAQ